MCRTTGMTEIDCATAAYGDSGVTELGCVTGSIYLGDPRVNRSQLALHLAASHIILSYNELHTPSCPSLDLACSVRDLVDPPGWVVSYHLTFSQCSSSQHCSVSQIPFGCREWCHGVLLMGSLPSSSANSPQMEPKYALWFGNLGTEWWERPILANMGRYGQIQLMKDIYHTSGAQCRRKWWHSYG